MEIVFYIFYFEKVLVWNVQSRLILCIEKGVQCYERKVFVFSFWYNFFRVFEFFYVYVIDMKIFKGLVFVLFVVMDVNMDKEFCFVMEVFWWRVEFLGRVGVWDVVLVEINVGGKLQREVLEVQDRQNFLVTIKIVNLLVCMYQVLFLVFDVC